MLVLDTVESVNGVMQLLLSVNVLHLLCTDLLNNLTVLHEVGRRNGRQLVLEVSDTLVDLLNLRSELLHSLSLLGNEGGLLRAQIGSFN